MIILWFVIPGLYSEVTLTLYLSYSRALFYLFVYFFLIGPASFRPFVLARTLGFSDFFLPIFFFSLYLIYLPVLFFFVL
jgi:hypothetical protein